jgi:hypothetical protein
MLPESGHADAKLNKRNKTQMNTTLRTRASLSVAAMLLTTALAVPAAAQSEVQPVPFTGAIHGHENDVPQGNPPSALAVDGHAIGIATHLGICTVTWKVAVNLADGSAAGAFHFIAANGDTLDTTIAGQGTPTQIPGLNRIVEINTITGGTGRFAGAKGSFEMDRLVDLNTGLTSGFFHGTITLPGSAR